MRRCKFVMDKKEYTLTSLPLKEVLAVKSLQKLSSNEEIEIEKLELAIEANTATEADVKRYDELFNKRIKNLVKILQMSLSKKHDEFKASNEQEFEIAFDKIAQVFDMRDIKRFVQFALSGILPVEDDDSEIEYGDEIVMK